MLSIQRDLAAARAFFVKALKVGTVPLEVITDRAASYPRVLDELLPQALHTVQQYSIIRSRQTTVGSRPDCGQCAASNATARSERWPLVTRSCRICAADTTTSRPSAPSTNGSSLPSASLPSASEPDPTAARISHLAATKRQRNSARGDPSSRNAGKWSATLCEHLRAAGSRLIRPWTCWLAAPTPVCYMGEGLSVWTGRDSKADTRRHAGCGRVHRAAPIRPVGAPRVDR